MVPADIFYYTESTQSGGWKGILLYQQLMGSVFGLQVVKGYFFIVALATPMFLLVPAMAHRALVLLEQELYQASGMSQKSLVSHIDLALTLRLTQGSP